MKHINYARMPGPGDLSGNSDHPGSPDYVEPDYGMDDASALVAQSLIKRDEVGELVDEVAEAAGLLNWISHNVNIPDVFLRDFQFLIGQSERLNKVRQSTYESLNGGEA